MIRLLVENYTNSPIHFSNKYFLDRTGISYYDDILDDRELGGYGTRDYYKFEKKVQADIVYMKPLDYIREIANNIFHKPYSSVLTRVSHENIGQYQELFEEGSKAPLTYINYRTDGQEGRHRMIAVSQINPMVRVPVLIVKDAEFTDDEVRKYVQDKWGPDPDGYWFRYITGRYPEDIIVDNEEN